MNDKIRIRTGQSCATDPVAAVGFSTCGEQYPGVHANQTLTGVAIGFSEPADG